MQWNISEDDQAFRTQVESCSYPIAEFNHQAHLRLAYIYLATAAPADALDAMSRTLRQLLDFNQVDASKYHQTLTQAWIYAVLHFMTKTPGCSSSTAFIEASPQLLNPQIMESHFSPEVLFSERARTLAVQPDRQPIPNYGN